MSQILLTTFSLIVTFLVLASFIPQVRHAWLRKEGGRVSLNYLQLNLICSTESLFLAFFFTVNTDEDVPFWAHAPRIALDWVNLAQFVGIWILFNFLAISRTRKAKRIALYVLFLIISLVPLMIDATTDLFCPSGEVDCTVTRRDPIEFLMALHAGILQPVTHALMVLSFYEQARQRTLDLSATGLKLQSSIFFVSAILWTFRLHIPWEIIGTETPLTSFYTRCIIWFQYVKFSAGADIIFAIGQCILLRLILRKSHFEATHTATERQPLLESPQESIENV
ncbi:unnamed protein product [Penicillium salamii]|nr:unnamed protein product [Penicillium salamii]CAG8397125.1 unnamed protein product [Penicillium salamii]